MRVASASHNRLNASEMVNAASVPSATMGNACRVAEPVVVVLRDKSAKMGNVNPMSNVPLMQIVLTRAQFVIERSMSVLMDAAQTNSVLRGRVVKTCSVCWTHLRAARLIQIVQCQARSVIGRLTSVLKGVVATPSVLRGRVAKA